MQKIQEKHYIQWRHVSSKENAADLGSRGGEVNETSGLWWNGPPWLAQPQNWPPDIVTSPTKETQAEEKLIKEVLAVTIETNDELDQLMQKWDLWKTIRVGSWVSRFIRNCRAKRQQRTTGPITTEETNSQIEFWERRTQIRCQSTTKFQEDQLRLNLQKNKDGLYECRGRIQGDYPIYLSSVGSWLCTLTHKLSTGELV